MTAGGRLFVGDFGGPGSRIAGHTPAVTDARFALGGDHFVVLGLTADESSAKRSTAVTVFRTSTFPAEQVEMLPVRALQA